ncbi:MAG: hypothetical protein ABMA64_11145 [Myxococcota bacterium]
MNALIPRDQVHRWSEEIGNQPEDHRSAITRLIRDQRRLSRFVEENAKSLSGVTGGVTVYLIGVVLRMFDLAGGRVRNVTWDDVREAEQRIQAQIDQLLPVDDGLVERAHALPRAQAHILDEALYALFEREPIDGEPAIEDAEAFKAYLLLWVATEALDKNWTPPKDFAGQAEYAFTPVA